MEIYFSFVFVIYAYIRIWPAKRKRSTMSQVMKFQILLEELPVRQ